MIIYCWFKVINTKLIKSDKRKLVVNLQLTWLIRHGIHRIWSWMIAWIWMWRMYMMRRMKRGMWRLWKSRSRWITAILMIVRRGWTRVRIWYWLRACSYTLCAIPKWSQFLYSSFRCYATLRIGLSVTIYITKLDIDVITHHLHVLQKNKLYFFIKYFR